MSSGIGYAVLFYVCCAIFIFSGFTARRGRVSRYPWQLLYFTALYQFVWATGWLFYALINPALGDWIKMTGAVLGLANGIVWIVFVFRAPTRAGSGR
jgi:hypothetical protein